MTPGDSLRNAKNRNRPETFNEFILRAHEDGWDEVSRLAILRARIARRWQKMADGWGEVWRQGSDRL